MELKIFIVLFCALFTGGHSLRCYECLGNMDSCENKEKTCPATDTTCVSATHVQTSGGHAVKKQSKGCTVTDACTSTSVNFGYYRFTMSTQCCTTDLCNDKYAPDSSNSPNGKQCYYCDGQSCFSKLDCLGDEDHCFKATKTDGSVSQTVKGCASKSVCDATSQYPPGYTSFSCCQGNLCDSAMSIKQNLLFLLWPLFFYILIH
ncbi:urokinase plasminogen activator surface receptor-like isoform X2 [Misgurnus anguillicaudatus]|uniref:urokinase plasminogen activator surface receptor-like isoform X1 n=1 Tax=Misgurnus anguillicaudatus TaxID=75329 RepID=UPI003CCF6786